MFCFNNCIIMTWRQSVIFLHLPHLVFCFASLIFYILALTLAVTLPESDAVQKTKIGVMCNVTRHRKNLPFVGVCLNPLWIFFDEIPWESSQFIGISSTKKKKQVVSVLDHWNRKDKACSFLGSGVLPPIRKLLAFIARKAAKEGKGLRSWSHLFFWCHFVLTKSSTSFSDFIFFWAWLFVFISKNLQYWQIFACCIGVRFLQTSCECGCAQPYGDQLNTLKDYSFRQANKRCDVSKLWVAKIRIPVIRYTYLTKSDILCVYTHWIHILKMNVCEYV